MPSELLLHLDNATVRRPEGIVLKNIHWTLNVGEQWAIVGPTGSGKSSLLDTVAGQLPVLSGHFHHPVGPLRDTVERVANDYRFDRRVASAAQFYQQRFNADTSEESPTVWEVLQNQVWPVGTHDPKSVPLPPPAYPEDWLSEVANQVNIAHLLQRKLTSLSNGETRRTLLARSLLRRPRILLLDNPFAGLDAESRQRLHQVLNTVAAEGISLVLATSLQEIPACMTHILSLAEGAIIESGPRTAQALQQPQAPVHALTNADRLRQWHTANKATFINAVKMQGVSVQYNGQKVLDNIDWTVRRGEKWAVLGPNGSGKSTLLSLITADNPQGYRNSFSLFDRRRGTGESIWDIKQKIGFVSPEVHLYFPRDLTVWKAVASGLFDTAGLFRKLTDAQTEHVSFVLNLLNIEDLRDKRFAQLSTGQQRWVLLARALVKNPPLLILDEPCQGLDPEHTLQFRDLVDELCQTSDRTLLYVSHYADDIPRCVTQVLQLAAGRGQIKPYPY
ncbi:ATP-binding cassette domain-containing protein [Nibrella saemangeumensis]|uniref:ATP-binding cassette domain-containing protein n=1 Tax=Nibrella saemangeumensis TaxID=1084526 RepID=A0ABP8NQ68_9BACT